MNLSMKQTHRHIEQSCGCKQGGEEGWSGIWGQQVQTIAYRMDRHKDPTVRHRELYSMSCGKP